MTRHVPHLYLPGPYEPGRIGVVESTRLHLEKVLRNLGPVAVTYTDGEGLSGSGVYFGGWIERGAEEIQERGHPVTIAVSPPKNKSRARFVVEKLAEMGVARLLWLATARTEGRMPRVEKSALWAQAALEQSRGSWLMEVSGPVAVSDMGRFGSVLLADPHGVGIDDIVVPEDAILCVGPEGGFAPDELPEVVGKLRLARNLLRVETAALVGAALLTHKASS
ncbi:MAG: RsmE family RNA methyltransferase [Acidimicrobiia bacterium]|nr:RsmE family RNA methyltransferase [Acidimicrobiia bacterium]